MADRYADCAVLDEKLGPANAAGRGERVRVVKTSEKYPLVRVVDRLGNVGDKAPDQVAAGQDRLRSQTAMVADHVTVKVKPGVSAAALAAYAAPRGGTVLRQLRTPGHDLYLVQCAPVTTETVPRALAALSQADSPVATVNPDYLVYALETVPDDPAFGNLWGLKNTGQTLSDAPRDPKTGIVGCDVKATEAWDLTTGSREVLVGIIDSGIDYTHEDLAANMWTHPGETGTDGAGHDKRSNGIDDDANGFVDDWHGWDFRNDDNDPMDDLDLIYHGTHCAGTIGAVGNNGLGVAGVCGNVSLVALKFLGASGSGATSDGIEAIYYATTLGAKLTSNSWGASGSSSLKSDPTDPLRQAIAHAGAHGSLFVAAAGNSASDNDGETTQYPSSYDCENIVAVAATDATDNLAPFSCYGATTVDLGAPGVNILSCKRGNQYQYLAGTSMATPHVAGAGALLAAARPTWTAAQLKTQLLANTDPLAALAGKCLTGGRLNTFRPLLSERPELRWAQTQLADAVGGNHDGLANPGETVQLNVTLQNWSQCPITGVGATLTCADPLITVTAPAAAFGDFAAVQRKTALEPFALAISPDCPTPREVTLNLSLADAGTGAWTDAFTVTVYTSYQITGTVTLDGAPAAGVTVEYQGPLSGSRVTDAAGQYRFGTLAGVSTVTAQKDGWLASQPVTVTLPASQADVNFAFTTATVAGRITEAASGTPLAGVTVTYGSHLVGAATSGSDGRYEFTRVYGRTVPLALTAAKDGYLDSAPQEVTVPPAAADVDVALVSPIWRVGPGSIATWGYDIYGMGVVPGPNRGFVAVAGGDYHTLGLKANGRLVAWGANGDGQCNVPSPNCGFIAIAAGATHCLGLKTDGSIAAWGYNGAGQCNVPSPNSHFVALAAGGRHSLALKADGSIVGWGDNYYGQCNAPTPNSNFVMVAAGADYTLGLKADGSIVAWGSNWYGVRNVPDPNSGFVAVAARFYNNLGLKADGSIVAWGDNRDGQGTVPSPNGGFVGVAAGNQHSLGLKTDGSIVAWGKNDYGQCNVPAPNRGFVAISAGGHHGLGLMPPFAEICLTGNGQEIADGDSTPDVADDTGFGSVAGGQTHSHTFTVANLGLADLILSETPQVTLGGPQAADFTVSSQPASPVAPGGSTTFTVQFAPSAPGLRLATVSIANNDADENPYTFSIQGAGNAPPTIDSPAWVDADPVTLPAGTTVHVVASDPDTDPLTYAWSRLSGPAIPTFATPEATDSDVTFHAAGDYVLRVTVADGKGGSVSSDVSVTVNAGAGVDPRADVNHDGVVNALDLQIVIANFGKTVADPGCDPRADANADAVVNALDLQIVIANFGQTVP